MGKSIYPTGPKGLVRPLTLHAPTTFFVSPVLGAGTLRTFRTRQKPDRYAPLSKTKKRKAALENQVAFSAERRIVINMRQSALPRRGNFTASWRADLSFGYVNVKENARKTTRIPGIPLTKKRETEFVMSATQRICCLENSD